MGGVVGVGRAESAVQELSAVQVLSAVQAKMSSSLVAEIVDKMMRRGAGVDDSGVGRTGGGGGGGRDGGGGDGG